MNVVRVHSERYSSFTLRKTDLVIGQPSDFKLRGYPPFVLGEVLLGTNAPCQNFARLSSLKIDGQELLLRPIDAFIRIPKTVELESVKKGEPCDAVLGDGAFVWVAQAPFSKLGVNLCRQVVVRGRYDGGVPNDREELRAGARFEFTVTLFGILNKVQS
jgi:hypothetical protein